DGSHGDGQGPGRSGKARGGTPEARASSSARLGPGLLWEMDAVRRRVASPLLPLFMLTLATTACIGPADAPPRLSASPTALPTPSLAPAQTPAPAAPATTAPTPAGEDVRTPVTQPREEIIQRVKEDAARRSGTA